MQNKFFIAILVLGFFITGALVTTTDFFVPIWKALQNYYYNSKSISYFKNVSGPVTVTYIPQAIPTSYKVYSQGKNSRLAILLTDNDAQWLGLAHGLKSIGVPFLITQDYRQALLHKVIYVYPKFSSSNLSEPALKALLGFPLRGGTLIVQDVDNRFNHFFGFENIVPVYRETELHFNVKLPETRQFIESEEQVIKIGNSFTKVNGVYAYSQPSSVPVATYKDGMVAIAQKSYGQGKTYALGIDVGRLLLTGYNNRQESISRFYVNHFEPSLDVLLRFLKNIYLQNQDNGVTLGTVPYGKSLAVIFTHDLDGQKAVFNALKYAAFEKKQGIKATYFMQVKYVRDWNDKPFFNPIAIQQLKQLVDMGMEIGSHSVSHSLAFDKFPLGAGTEQYPKYLPYVKNKSVTVNGTILGELRVSRFLLEHFLFYRIVSFRPGFLKNPYALPQLLVATNYHYSSAVTANESLTHLPFQLNNGRAFTSEVPIYEFPVTIEDQDQPPMLARLPQAIQLAKKLSRYGGLFVILIHPDICGQKLEFENKFVKNMGNSIWYGDLREFGAWWVARDKIDIDVSARGKLKFVSLSVPLAISGLTLNVPPNWQCTGSIPNNLKLFQSGQQIIIEHIFGNAKLLFAKK